MKLPKELKEKKKENLKARSKQKRKKKKYRLGSSRSTVHAPKPKKKFYESFTPYLVVIGIVFVIGVVIMVITFENPDVNATTDNSDPYGTNITFQTINGNTIELSDHQEQVVILYFFDLDCPPCGPEADVISDIDDAYSNSRVFIVLVTVHSWDSDDGLNQFKIDHNLNRPIVRDDNSGTYSSHFSITYTPTTILLDEDGNQVNRYIGHDTNHFNQIKNAIDGL
jgi:peroxiredoxin